MMIQLQRVPDFFKPEITKVPFVRGGETRYSVMSERKRESRINDLPEASRCRRSPLPQWPGDHWFVVAEFPVGIASQGFTERRSFRCSFGLREHSRISELHVNLNQHQATQQKPFTGIKDAELIGARIELTANGKKQYRWKHSNHSYKSGGALNAHFGLGMARHADVTVTLLDGRSKTFTAIVTNQSHKLSLE